VLTFALLYLCLGPCGRALSLDALLARRKPDLRATAPTRSVWANVALRLLQVHLAVVYLMMALGKLMGGVWWTGQAVWWLAARPDSRLVDLTGLLAVEPYGLYLVNVWTHVVVAVELTFSVLVWLPRTRMAVLAASTLVWISLALVTGLVPFCLLMMTANLAFVPADRLRRWLRADGPQDAAAATPPARARATTAAS
jgi:hypothetical protein